ncbi:hypothetical protein NX794_27420 [Streptomyces sp. LP11]|uniref:Secreted protein n=1 Tax=Streptomyces pyxinicus TaxID=2970331 RepID=A0ABT2B8R6_9ACTN|nr:hypothetical protein [Streptomyces sp. LP11]MCS0604915.1 hypothetical protein [Streptomyces sp. LP11]
MRRLTRVLGVLGGSALLTLGLTQSADAAVGNLHLNQRVITDPARWSCHDGGPLNLIVHNYTSSPVVVFDQPACAGNAIGLVAPISNGFFPRGWSVRVMQ